MKIACDADNVLVPFDEKFILFNKNKYGSEIELKDLFSQYYSEIYCLNKKEIDKRINEFQKEWLHKLPTIPGAIKSTKRLKDKGHELIIITSRTKKVERITKDYFNRVFKGIFSEIYFSSNTFAGHVTKSKSDICKEQGVDVIIDDVIKYVLECDCNQVLFGNYPWNNETAYNNIRKKDWDATEKYIDQLSKKIK